MSESPPNLDYASPPAPKQQPAVVPLLVPVAFGVIVCLLNAGAILLEGGESFFAPALGLLSLVVFMGGAIASAIFWFRGAGRGAAILILINAAGIFLSVVMAWVGVPKR